MTSHLSNFPPSNTESVQQNFEMILSSISDGIYVLDRAWCFTYVNDRYCEMVGTPREELLGQNIWELFPAAIETDAYDQFHQAIHEQAARQFEYLYVPWNCWHDHRIYPSPNGLTVFLADITTRKQAEEALRESETRLQLALQGAGQGIWDWDLHQQILTWDERCKEIFGLPADFPVTYEWHVAALHPDDRQQVSDAATVALEHRTEFQEEYRTFHPDGSMRWILARGHGFYDAAGEPYRMSGTVMDITDTKQRELERQQLEQNKEFLHQLDSRLRQLSDADAMIGEVLNRVGEYFKVDHCLWHNVDLQADVITVEQDWCSQTEMPSLIGIYRLSEMILPALIEAHKAGETAIVENVTTYIHTAPFAQNYHNVGIRSFVAVPCVIAGEWVAHLTLNCSTVRMWRSNEGELLQETVARLWSIIEQTRAIAALREEQEWMRLATEAAELGVWSWEIAKDRVMWSDRAKVLFGLPSSTEMTHDTFINVLHPDERDRMRVLANEVLDQRLDYQTEYRVLRENGGIRWIAARGRALYNAEGQPIRMLGTVQDITNRVRLEQDRERLLQQEQAAREAAETANRIKDEFLAVLSHELRSPLNPILGWAKLLRSSKLDAARTDQALAIIERNAKLQADLIEDLLDVSRILQGKLSLSISSIDLATTIRSAVETVRLAAEAKLIAITADLDRDIGQVSGDPTRLQQVVWNLLSNAVKFTPAGGQVTVRLEQVDQQAKITVCDTGKGIASDFLPYVFDYFRQEDGATTRKFGGLGLGLAIVRHLVELHGGTVQAESPGEGLGATFTVNLSLMSLQSVQEVDRDSAEPSLNLDGVKILVIDDETDSRELVVYVLEQVGATVRNASTAAEGFLMISESPPDILLSDIGMPDMDGYMLMRQVRAVLPELKAIALTAYAGDFNQQKAIKSGFQEHIAKPVDPEHLIKTICRLLQRSKAQTL